MCVIVNLDLVVPAVISLEYFNMRCLRGYEQHSDTYINAMTISTDQIMNYAIRMKSWDLGRVIVNFSMEDARRYLQSHPDMFMRIDNSDVYFIRLQKDVDTDVDKNKDVLMSELIRDLTSKINYSPRVLRTVGLLHDACG